MILPAASIVRTLEQLGVNHGQLQAIDLNNGNELWSVIFIGYCDEKGIDTKHLIPTCLTTKGGCKRLPKNESSMTAKKDPITHSEEHPPGSTEIRPKTTH